MKLHEIADNETLFGILARRILSKNEIYMWTVDPETYDDITVNVDAIEDGADGLIHIHYILPSQPYWSDYASFREHEIEISQKEGKWWIHEAK